MCLFGEEDIQEELYIAVCEWPTDESTVLVYGYWLVYILLLLCYYGKQLCEWCGILKLIITIDGY